MCILDDYYIFGIYIGLLKPHPQLHACHLISNPRSNPIDAHLHPMHNSLFLLAESGIGMIPAPTQIPILFPAHPNHNRPPYLKCELLQ